MWTQRVLLNSTSKRRKTQKKNGWKPEWIKWWDEVNNEYKISENKLDFHKHIYATSTKTPKRPKLLLEGGKKGFKRERMATRGDNSKNKLCQNRKRKEKNVFLSIRMKKGWNYQIFFHSFARRWKKLAKKKKKFINVSKRIRRKYNK